MIRGIGIDVVEVDRIRRAMERPGFLAKVLTSEEQSYCRTPEQVAGRWAVKEAMMKCLPPGFIFTSFEVLPGENGAPRVTRPVGPWHVSISHEKGLAVAVAVLLEGGGR